MILRIKYAKTDKGRFLSHLDLLRTWERSLRRARVPIAYSQGFNPHPKMAFGSALAVGVTSSGEYMDVELKNVVSIQEMKNNLEKYLPGALEVFDIKEIDKNNAALMSIINRAKYNMQVNLLEDITEEEVISKINDLLNQEKIIIMRKTKKGIKEKDIKNGIYALEGRINNKGVLNLRIDVQTGSEGNIRPEELVRSLKDSGIPLDMDTLLIHREGLYISSNKGLISPLDV